MPTINGTNFQMIKKFFTDVYNTFIAEPLFKKFFDDFQYYFDNEQYQPIIVGIFNKQELLLDLPKYLNKPKTTKSKKITNWPDIITEKIFYKLLRMQTEGCEYYTFEYYIMKFHLKTDMNQMIIFTEKFPFDNKIKKEALFIWGIFNYITHHPILKKFLHYIIYTFQERVGLGSCDTKNKEYDVCFPSLQIVIEIDENHDENNYNDILKNAIMKQNGLNLIRLNFQKIYTDDNIGKGEILEDKDANAYLLNSEYYKKFLTNLSYTFINALLKNYSDVRTFYIMHLFRQMLSQRIDDIDITIQNNLKKISTFEDKMRMPILSNTDYEILYRLRENIQKSISYNIKYRKKVQRLTDGLTQPNFIELFQLKDKCKKANYGKVITYTEIVKLVKISDKVAFIVFLCETGIIDNIDVNIEDILISWKDMCIIISKLQIKAELQELLFLYYLEVDESYEKIITLMNIHTDKLHGDPKSYNICKKYIESKYKYKYDNKEKLLRDKYNKLVDEFEVTKFNYSIEEPSQDIISDESTIEFDTFVKNSNLRFEEMMRNNPLNRMPPPFNGIVINNIVDNSIEDSLSSEENTSDQDEVNVSDSDQESDIE
jgi:hypothetical protein